MRLRSLGRLNSMVDGEGTRADTIETQMLKERCANKSLKVHQ